MPIHWAKVLGTHYVTGIILSSSDIVWAKQWNGNSLTVQSMHYREKQANSYLTQYSSGIVLRLYTICACLFALQIGSYYHHLRLKLRKLRPRKVEYFFQLTWLIRSRAAGLHAQQSGARVYALTYHFILCIVISWLVERRLRHIPWLSAQD